MEEYQDLAILAGGYLKGDTAAQAKLAGQLTSYVRALVARIFRSLQQADRDDIASEVLVIVIENLKAIVEGRISSPKAWIRKVLIFQCLQFFKAKSRSKEIQFGAGVPLPDPQDSRDPILTMERLDALDAMKKDLNPQLVPIFDLLKADMKPAEIAREINVDPGTVSRAVDRIEQRGLKYFPEYGD